jgi:uncharacterized cupin superfamily protein
VIPEAAPEQSESGLVATSRGWFVLNALEARWHHADGRGAKLLFDGETEFPQVGINLYVLEPGEPMGMYHWEADQEDFLVLSGEALLIVEGQERPLRQWDFVHCPPQTKHIVVGAGNGPCVVLAVGARENQEPGRWGGYPVDEVALKHDAGVEQETDDAKLAYGQVGNRKPTRYREGWLPGR